VVTKRAFSEIMELGQTGITTGEKINKGLLCTENKGNPVWLVAAQNGYLEALQKVWNWAKRN